MGAEQDRVAGFGKLENGLRQAGDWYRWGPYVSERQWGTVREVNPPVQAWAALEVFAVDEGRDLEFLSRVFDKLLVNLQDRLISIFTRDTDGRRPCFGGASLLQSDPAWRDNLVFGEYFNGDTAAALGASHQTGWTGLIADVIRRRYGLVRSIGDVIMVLGQESRP